MRNANWTRILTILLSLLALYALLAVIVGIIQRFIVPVLLVILATILAFVLTPVVGFIQRRLHLFRWMSILVSYLLVIAILGGLGYFLTAPLVSQTKALADAIKNPTHLATLTQVKQTTTLLAKQTGAYQRGWVNYSNLGSSGAADALCYPAYYLDESRSALATVAGCRGATGFWRITLGPKWRQKLGPSLPTVVSLLVRQIAALGRSSIRTTLGGHVTSVPIPATKVPPSYVKPVDRSLARVQTDIHRARLDITNENNAYGSDVTGVVKDVKVLESDVSDLYTTVKTTPVLILALQNQIDSHHLPIDLRKLLGSAINKLRSQGTTLLNNAVTILTGTINVIFDLIIIAIMSLYLLADGERFIRWVMGLIPERHREQAWFFVESLSKVLGGYIRGQLIVAITIGILAGAGCYVIGVPYALLLGIFAFLAESIPVLGPVLASVPAILVAFFTLPLLRTIVVIGWFVLIQQVEQNVVGPRITGRAVGIHPVAAMIAVIIGLEIGGIWGAFLAVPVTGILFVITAQAYSYLVLRRPLPTAEMPESVEVETMTHGVPPAAR